MKAIRHPFAVCGLLCVSIASGCGPAAGDAEGECDSMLDSYCVMAHNCTVTDNYDACLTRQREDINCADAADVSDNYDTCIEEIDSADCASWDGELPASCDGVILF